MSTKSSIVLIFLLCFTFLNATTGNIWYGPQSARSPSGNQGRVLGGRKSSHGDYPFMASLMRDGAHFCGGSILSDQIILTAAHCWRSPKEIHRIRVLIGTLTLLKLPHDGLKHSFEVEAWIKHEQYKTLKNRKGYIYGFDVAVIKLKSPINFGKLGPKRASKICIPSSTDKPIGAECEVVGWGWTEKTYGRKPDPNDPNRSLRSVETAITRKAKCLSHFPIKKKDDFICAAEYSKGACAGDSGGPYICPVKGDRKIWLQFGITSFGAKSCKGSPSVYTKVSVYSEWIVKTAERLLSPSTTTAKGSITLPFTLPLG